MRILGIDQGPEISGYAEIDELLNVNKIGVFENDHILSLIGMTTVQPAVLFIEHFVNYGFGVGATTFEAIEWGGRFKQRMYDLDVPVEVEHLTNRQWALQLTGNQQAKATQLKAGVLSVFPKDAEKGQKKCTECHGKGWKGRDHDDCEACLGTGIGRYPGPLSECRTHAWDALGIALAGWDRRNVGFLEGLR